MVGTDLLILTLMRHIKATCFNHSWSSSGHPVSGVYSSMFGHCPTFMSDSFLFNVAVTNQYSLFIVMKLKA